MKVRRLFLLLLYSTPFHGFCQSEKQPPQGMVRLKDLVEIKGVRGNPLVGIGLVVGLQGTGDSKASLLTNAAVSQLINKLGFAANPQSVVTRNVAAVVATGELPPFAKVGDRIQVRVSSVGDSSSLEGGTLLQTHLTGGDGNVYAIVQGPISQGVSMVGAQGGGAGSGAGNRGGAPKTVAITYDAYVEKEFPTQFIVGNEFELHLKEQDFTTASRVAKAINESYFEFLANAKDASTIQVRLPQKAVNNVSFSPVDFVSTLEQIKVQPDNRAVVVINERTGTVIAGQHVGIDPVAISHGSLEVTVGDSSGFVAGLPKTTSVADLVSALNSLGAGPKDLVAILQTLSVAKALKGELKLM